MWLGLKWIQEKDGNSDSGNFEYKHLFLNIVERQENSLCYYSRRMEGQEKVFGSCLLIFNRGCHSMFVCWWKWDYSQEKINVVMQMGKIRGVMLLNGWGRIEASALVENLNTCRNLELVVGACKSSSFCFYFLWRMRSKIISREWDSEELWIFEEKQVDRK